MHFGSFILPDAFVCSVQLGNAFWLPCIPLQWVCECPKPPQENFRRNVCGGCLFVSPLILYSLIVEQNQKLRRGKFKQIRKFSLLARMCAFKVRIKLIILILHFSPLKCFLKPLDNSIEVILFQNHNIRLLRVLNTILFIVALYQCVVVSAFQWMFKESHQFSELFL